MKSALTNNFYNDSYAPVFLKDEVALRALQRKQSQINIVDAFSYQLKELFIIQNPSLVSFPKEEIFQSDQFLQFTKKNAHNFTYVYFPWNNSVVKTVTKKNYLELKTNRNRDLITKEEQEKLRSTKVAVFGMSVGSNISLVLTQAGISNEIIIADFDNLDTTNLNRIVAGVHQIGLNKCVVAARRIYEDNPFAKVTIMKSGVNKKNLEQLLVKNKIDVIVDEVDAISVKIDIRNLAQKYKVPVVMVTDNGEGVVLHIERYDLAHKKIFGKEKKYFESLISSGLPREKVLELIVSDIVGGIEKVDKRMHESVQKVLKKELISWPQLGSAALLAGVMATHAIKRIVLGYDKKIDVRGHISPLEVVYGTH